MIADYRGGVTCLYDIQLLGTCLHASESGGRYRPEAVRGMPDVPIAPPSHRAPGGVGACRLYQQSVKSTIAGSLPIGVKRVSWAGRGSNRPLKPKPRLRLALGASGDQSGQLCGPLGRSDERNGRHGGSACRWPQVFDTQAIRLRPMTLFNPVFNGVTPKGIER